MIVGLIMGLALAAGAPSAAPPAAAQAADKGPRAQEIVIRGPRGEELICKKYQPVGSRLPIRACRTAYDWAELNAASLRNLDQMIGKGTYP
jgi:hypothetical protein